MIEGWVNSAYEPMVTLSLQDAEGNTVELTAVVDTGFNGFLTLPSEIVTELRLVRGGRARATLADGSIARYGIFPITVIWDDTSRLVDALETDGDPLIGMALLDQHDLYIRVREGGRVSIQATQ